MIFFFLTNEDHKFRVFFCYLGTDQYSNIFQFNCFVFGKLFQSEILKKIHSWLLYLEGDHKLHLS